MNEIQELDDAYRKIRTYNPIPTENIQLFFWVDYRGKGVPLTEKGISLQSYYQLPGIFKVVSCWLLAV